MLGEGPLANTVRVTGWHGPGDMVLCDRLDFWRAGKISNAGKIFECKELPNSSYNARDQTL
jgi:hypothetical protein